MRHFEERRTLHMRHESAKKCLDLQTHTYPQELDEESYHRQWIHLNRRNRRQWAVLERDHQIQWDDLERKVRRQWERMERRHREESQELEKRHPNIRSEEMDRLLEECIRRRKQLGKKLEAEKELKKKVKEELESTPKKDLENEQQRPSQGATR